MSNQRTQVGIALIVTGSVLLVAILFFLLYRGSFPELDKRFGEAEQTSPQITNKKLNIQAPIPTGSSELSDFYARNPPRNRPETKRKNTSEEEPLDTSLWKTDYYTSPEGQIWQKDSNSENILAETKKGEQAFSAFRTKGEDSLRAQNPSSEKLLHVEFWDSPVNYKGYKLDGNNLILFGINSSDTLRFERHTDGVWMYHRHKIYLLKPSLDFLPFEERIAPSALQNDSVQPSLPADSLRNIPVLKQIAE